MFMRIERGWCEYGLLPNPKNKPAMISRLIWNPDIRRAASIGDLPNCHLLILLNLRILIPWLFAMINIVIARLIHRIGRIMYVSIIPSMYFGSINVTRRYMVNIVEMVIYHIIRVPFLILKFLFFLSKLYIIFILFL